MNARAQVQPLQTASEALLAQRVAAVDVGDVPPISVAGADGERGAERVDLARREVKQRADGRVGLAVVVAEVPLEVAFEFGDAPVRKQLPTVRESLVQLYFDRAVIADRIGEAVRHAICAGVTRRLAVSAQRLVADAEGGVDEVRVARRAPAGDVLI